MAFCPISDINMSIGAAGIDGPLLVDLFQHALSTTFYGSKEDEILKQIVATLTGSTDFATDALLPKLNSDQMASLMSVESNSSVISREHAAIVSKELVRTYTAHLKALQQFSLAESIVKSVCGSLR